MSNHINQFIEKLKLGQLDNNENLYFIQNRLGVKPSSLLVAISIFVIIVVLTSNANALVIGLVCCLIPAYFTFVSLQSQQQQTYIKYLTYWIIFAIVQTIAPLLNFILPSLFYVILRVGLTVVLLHPTFNYTVLIYKEYVQPYFNQYQKKVFQTLANVEKGRSPTPDQYKKFSRK